MVPFVPSAIPTSIVHLHPKQMMDQGFLESTLQSPIGQHSEKHAIHTSIGGVPGLLWAPPSVNRFIRTDENFQTPSNRRLKGQLQSLQ